VQLRQGTRAKHGLAEKPYKFDKVPEEVDEELTRTAKHLIIEEEEECNHLEKSSDDDHNDRVSSSSENNDASSSSGNSSKRSRAEVTKLNESLQHLRRITLN
jgi:hypothetical protein